MSMVSANIITCL